MESKHCPHSTRAAHHEKRPRRRHSGSLSFARWARKDAAELKETSSSSGAEACARLIDAVG